MCLVQFNRDKSVEPFVAYETGSCGVGFQISKNYPMCRIIFEIVPISAVNNNMKKILS